LLKAVVTIPAFQNIPSWCKCNQLSTYDISHP
jgi:hypothetical protein